MNYFKSIDFPLHLMVYWWLFWIAISYTPFNEFVAPSLVTLIQFLLLLSSFVIGHAVIKKIRPYHRGFINLPYAHGLRLREMRVRLIWAIGALGSLSMLLVSLKMAGAFETSFVDYFVKLRVNSNELLTVEVTGSRALDVLTKIFAFPLAYTLLVTALAVELSGLRNISVICILSFISFSYLWQINYPLIHLFWLMVFYVLHIAHKSRRFNWRLLSVLVLICAILFASAANRYGGDVLGALQRYVVGYHLVGFSFYDYHYRNVDSILHAHSFGRSSLGFLEQILENALEPFSSEFRAASFENAEFTNTAIDIGSQQAKEFNAFGTIIFTLYRDLNWVGIFIGGFIYGSVTTLSLYRSHYSWRHGALFFMLATAWMMGMMVSPLEAAYFWFVIVTLSLLQIVNRGVRWPSVPQREVT
ncbi:MAG: hypothetical protein II007_12025 [Gammaproteobacteria bacterium]|nr:hypothetical protein [Gammaproteobacteria bacterium]